MRADKEASAEGSDSRVEHNECLRPDNEDVMEVVGRAAGLFVPFGITAYAAGLIITNAYWSVRYGVVSFALNRAHYVVVGFVWILLTALFAQGIALLALKVRPRRWIRRRARIWRWLRFPVSGIIFSAVLPPITSLNYLQSVVVVFPIAGFVWAATVIARRARESRSSFVTSPEEPPRESLFKNVLGFLPYLTGLLLLCIWSYSAILFPKLSPFFGGPDSSNAVIVLQILSQSPQLKAERVLSPIKVNGTETEVVRVLWFDSDYVAIAPLSRHGKAVLLNRTLISSIRLQ